MSALNVQLAKAALEIGAAEITRMGSRCWTWCDCCGVRIPAPARMRMGSQLCESCYQNWQFAGPTTEIRCWHAGKVVW